MAYDYRNEEADAPKVTQQTLSGAIDAFDKPLDRAMSIVERLHKLCDRVYGPQPQEVASGAKLNEAPHSMIASVHQKCQRLNVLLEQMTRSLERLEGSIG